MKTKPIFILLLLSTLTGCSVLESLNVLELIKFDKKTSLKSLSVTAEENANQDMATALDVVFIKDKDLINKLPTDGLIWFQQRQGWVDNNPKKITLLSIEIPPQRSLEEVKLPENWDDSNNVVAYLKYFSKGGQNRLDLTSFEHAYIELGPKSVKFGEAN